MCQSSREAWFLNIYIYIYISFLIEAKRTGKSICKIFSFPLFLHHMLNTITILTLPLIKYQFFLKWYPLYNKLKNSLVCYMNVHFRLTTSQLPSRQRHTLPSCLQPFWQICDWFDSALKTWSPVNLFLIFFFLQRRDQNETSSNGGFWSDTRLFIVPAAVTQSSPMRFSHTRHHRGTRQISRRHFNMKKNTGRKLIRKVNLWKCLKE